MIIRQASKNDYDNLFELNKEWYNEGISPYSDNSTKSEFFKELNKSSVFVAIDKEIIGFLICKIKLAKEDNKIHNILKNEEYADLDSIYVKKKYRNKGVGTKLLKHCIKTVKSAGYKRIILSADSKQMSKLVKFYNKNGFKTLYTQMMVEFK